MSEKMFPRLATGAAKHFCLFPANLATLGNIARNNVSYFNQAIIPPQSKISRVCEGKLIKNRTLIGPLRTEDGKKYNGCLNLFFRLNKFVSLLQFLELNFM